MSTSLLTSHLNDTSDVQLKDQTETSSHETDDEMPPLVEIRPALKEPSVADIMTNLQIDIDVDAKANICNVDRSDVLDGGMRCFRKKTFNPWARLFIKFVGEDGCKNAQTYLSYFESLARMHNGEHTCCCHHSHP